MVVRLAAWEFGKRDSDRRGSGLGYGWCVRGMCCQWLDSRLRRMVFFLELCKMR